MKSGAGSSGEGDPSELQYDPDKHIYTYRGETLLSVTQVLDICGLISPFCKDDAAATKGTYVAQATHYYDEGDLDVENLNDQLLPYVFAWKQFKVDSNCRIIAAEERVWHPHFMFAGTLDRRLILRDLEAILDIKTGQPEPWHALQTAGYAECFDRPLSRYSLYLRPDGGYKLKKHENTDDGEVFFGCLYLALWRQRNNVK